jgi:hypothetical protein
MKIMELYEKFVEHTNLRDSMYKTVFIQIDEVLSIIQHLSWKKLEYKLEGAEAFDIDFEHKPESPAYIVEMIKNFFEKSFTFPDKSVITVTVEYRNKDYQIVCADNELTLPNELGFLSQYPIFNFFLISTRVNDLFKEFDNIFSFTNSFKAKIGSIYLPLLRKFEEDLSKDQIDTGEISPAKVAGSKAFLENLKRTKASLDNELTTIAGSKEKLIDNYTGVMQRVKIRESLTREHKILQSEYSMLKESYEDKRLRFDRLIDIVSEIDAELTDLLGFSPNDHQADITFLRDKKIDFVKDKGTLQNELNQLKSVMDTTLNNLNAIVMRVNELNSYTINDATVLATQIEDLSTLYDSKVTEKITIETEIKNQMKISDEDQAKLYSAKEKIVSGDSGVIVQHLANPLQPSSVTIVLNYLRYTFVYNATRIASTLVNVYKDLDTPTLQALACKLALIECFGIYYKNIFSIVDFVDNRVERVNLLKGEI